MTAIRERMARIGLPLVLLILILALAGCGEAENGEVPKQEEDTAPEEIPEETEDGVQDTELYILLYSNPDTERLFLQCVNTGRQEEFAYNGGTYIYNRYGESTTISQIPVGTLVYLAYTDKMLLTSLAEATDTFLYEDITSYSQDAEKDMFSILGSNYFYDKDLKVFSQESLIALNEVSSRDALTIRGTGKRIVSIVVSRGHGTVALKNTELFEGGMVSIGNVEARVITPDMKLEIPEGTYRLSVANDGYGGSCEITVERFEELEVDLEPLKGEGPRYCQLRIDVAPEDAVVTLDGTEFDCGQAQQVKYGVYEMKARASGYESWSGKLVVSSEDAVIEVSLVSLDSSGSEKTEEKEESGDGEASDSQESGNEASDTVTTEG